MEPNCSLWWSQQPETFLVLRQMNSVYIIQPFVSKIHFNIIFPFCLGIRELSNQKSVCTFHLPMRATFHAHLIIFDLFTLILPGEGYKLWISTLCSFSKLQHPSVQMSRVFQATSLHTGACTNLTNAFSSQSRPHNLFNRINAIAKAKNQSVSG